MERRERDELQDRMVRLADGDRSAFDPLYAALWPLVGRFARRAAPPSECEDVAQAVLLKVFARATEFDPARDALSWILGITAFECRTARQRARRRREEPLPPAADASPHATVSSPEELAIARDLEAAALEVIGTLRPVDEETLRRVIAGERPEVPAPTFRKRLERALDRVRAAWKEKHGTD